MKFLSIVGKEETDFIISTSLFGITYTTELTDNQSYLLPHIHKYAKYVFFGALALAICAFIGGAVINYINNIAQFQYISNNTEGQMHITEAVRGLDAKAKKVLFNNVVPTFYTKKQANALWLKENRLFIKRTNLHWNYLQPLLFPLKLIMSLIYYVEKAFCSLI